MKLANSANFFLTSKYYLRLYLAIIDGFIKEIENIKKERFCR